MPYRKYVVFVERPRFQLTPPAARFRAARALFAPGFRTTNLRILRVFLYSTLLNSRPNTGRVHFNTFPMLPPRFALYRLRAAIADFVILSFRGILLSIDNLCAHI